MNDISALNIQEVSFAPRETQTGLELFRHFYEIGEAHAAYRGHTDGRRAAVVVLDPDLDVELDDDEFTVPVSYQGWPTRAAFATPGDLVPLCAVDPEAARGLLDAFLDVDWEESYLVLLVDPNGHVSYGRSTRFDT